MSVDIIDVNILDNLSLDRLADTATICEGDTITIASGTSPFRYSWSGSPDLSGINTAAPRFYGKTSTQINVLVADSGNVCSGVDSIHIKVNPKPLLIFTTAELLFCKGDTIRFADYTDDSLTYVYKVQNENNYTNGIWISDSLGRFWYQLTYSYTETGCSNIHGNNYNVNYKDDSVRIADAGTHLQATVFGDNSTQWIEWFVNGQNIRVNSDTIDVSRLSDGDSIQVRTSGPGNCNILSNILIWRTLGIEDSFIEFSIYPNPSSGNFTIESRVPIMEVTIYDLSGQSVHEGNSNEISINLSPGAYYIKVATKEGTGTKKLLINR